MLNFTVGPVMMDEETMNLGSQPVPYFRTDEFSAVMHENERLLCEFAGLGERGRAVFLTGSGTSAMEASIMNFFTQNDKLLVVNGGSFGQRFVDLCRIHNLDYTEIKLSYGKSLTHDMLEQYACKGYTALVMQHHETSTGVLYDLNMAGAFCRKQNMFFLVDCISSFLAEEIDMQNMNVDAVIIGSQKAVALPPGISCVIMNENAVSRVQKNEINNLYFDFKLYLKDGERGQTPFTPAVGILLQMNEKLRRIKNNGGVQKCIEEVAFLSSYFRNSIKDLPFSLVAESPSHAVTALYSGKIDAKKLFSDMKEKYGIWICPNGGEMAHSVFRVGHIGNIKKENIDTLVAALKNLVKEYEEYK